MVWGADLEEEPRGGEREDCRWKAELDIVDLLLIEDNYAK